MTVHNGPKFLQTDSTVTLVLKLDIAERYILQGIGAFATTIFTDVQRVISVKSLQRN